MSDFTYDSRKMQSVLLYFLNYANNQLLGLTKLL